MADIVLHCSCCGYALLMPEGVSLQTCPACDTQNARPQSMGESLEMLRRAVDQRLACDFVNAENTYQRVLAYYPREHEALWGRLLCHYGVEYVRDTRSGQYMPTVHTVHPMPLRANQEYRQACDCAPADVRAQYERDAAYIDEAQDAIRELAKKCPAYDIFLCHKTTKIGSGEKTQDYVRALELYQLLTAKGYRVFFAPTSLASVAGANYEAGIYHALHTAKVMLLVCSDAAHLVSPWVQSEWSRFLSLMNVDPDRRLVPLLYEHFSPSRLPEQLVYRNLQGLDMGQLNAKDNLLGLLQEVVGGDAPMDDPADPAVAPLLQRTRMFMEDGEWQKADEYAERVLDIAPENGAAYVCKLLIAFKCVKIADLASQPDRAYEERGDYRKAMRYADAATKKQLVDVGAAIDARNEEKRLAGLYAAAETMMQKQQYWQAGAQFAQLGDFRDAKAKAEACRRQEEQRLAGLYADAKSAMSAGSYLQAATRFEEIRDFRDSAAMAKECRRLQKAHLSEVYARAEQLMQEGEYQDAIAEFEKLQDYRDAKSLIGRCRQLLDKERLAKKYHDARELMKKGEYGDAAVQFDALGDFGDAKKMAKECRERERCAKLYEAATDRMKAKAYRLAVEYLTKVGDYRDAKALLAECQAKVREQQEAEDRRKAQEEKERKEAEEHAARKMQEIRDQACSKAKQARVGLKNADKHATITFLSEGETGSVAFMVNNTHMTETWGNTMVVKPKVGCEIVFTTNTLKGTRFMACVVVGFFVLVIMLMSNAFNANEGLYVVPIITSAVAGVIAEIAYSENAKENEQRFAIQPGCDYWLFRNIAGKLEIEKL